MDRERQVIESEKAKAERMERQLANLSQEIERERRTLDRTRQFEVDQFNRKVESYNALLEEARAQDRWINQLVDNFNQKLRQNRR